MTSDRTPAHEPSSLEVIKDYNATDYRTVWQKPEAIFSGRFEDRLARRLLATDPGWFVDIGAGYGRLHPLYARPGRRVVLVDYAANLIQLAAEALAGDESVWFVVADAYHLPFRDDVFAAGLSVRTFHHMTAPGAFLRECARVLNPGAHVVVEYSNKRNLPRLARHPRSALARDHEEYGHLHFGTHPAAFAELAAAAGFRVERTLGTGFLSRLVTERTRAAATPLAAAETALDVALGGVDLAPMSFADLVKGDGAAGARPALEFDDLLRCPSCAGELARQEGEMRCEGCGRAYSRDGRVLDFRLATAGTGTP